MRETSNPRAGDTEDWLRLPGRNGMCRDNYRAETGVMQGQLQLKGTGTDTGRAGHHPVVIFGVFFNHFPPSSQANAPIAVSHQVTNEGEGTGRTLQQSGDTREAPALQSKKRWICFFRVCITLPEPLGATACDIHTWLVPFAKSQPPALQQQ